MTKAVISIINGGLGNQLFIYAAGRAFASEALNQECETFDFSRFQIPLVATRNAVETTRRPANNFRA